MADTALKRLAATRNPGRWIIAALEGVQESHGTGRMDPGWFHPSSLGDPCDAKLAFQFLGAPAIQNIAAKTQRIFDLGHARDLTLKNDMARAGVSLIKKEEDRSITIPELYIRGELDDLVINPLTGKKYVIDYKTMRPDEWEHLEVVKPSHHIQVHPYQFAKGVFEGFVLYENKGNQELKTHPADFDKSIWQEQIVNRIHRILDGLRYNRVDRNPVNCTWCPFFANGTCGSNEIAKLKSESGLKFP